MIHCVLLLIATVTERKDTWLFDAPDGTLRQTNLIADRNFCHVQK